MNKRRIGVWDPEKIDSPENNWMHPTNMIKDEDVCGAYGKCHDVAKIWAEELGGNQYRTAGGEHSIMIKDDLVYDPVRFGGKKKPMPIDEYLEDTPFEFEFYD